MDISRPIAPHPYNLLPAVPAFTVVSDDITDGAPLSHAQTEDGGSHSPHLRWEGFPSETKSFMVSCYDHDAPGLADSWHWTVINIQGSVTEIPAEVGKHDADTLPEGAFHLMNDIGTLGYAGSAPPPGDYIHRYFFAVHALKVENL